MIDDQSLSTHNIHGIYRVSVASCVDMDCSDPKQLQV